MKTLSIGSNRTQIPVIGYGTGTTWFKGSEDTVDRASVETFKKAIGLGYCHLDCAEMYNTEKELGIAIKESRVSRSSLFVTTKCVTPNPADIPGAIKVSLEKLQLDYLDLYLIHSPFVYSTPSQLQEAWRQMEFVQKQGLVRNIGVSNFQTYHLKTVLSTAQIKPAINQIEFHPYLQRDQLRQLMAENDIALAAFSTLTPLTNAKAKSAKFEAYISSLATKYNLNESDQGQILLVWARQQNAIVITTSRSEERLKRTLDTQGAILELTQEEVETIKSLGRQVNFRTFFVDEIGTDNFE